MPKILADDQNLAITTTLEPSSTVAAKTNVTAEAKLTQGAYLLPGYTVQMQIADGGKATFQGGGQTLPSLITDPLGRVNAVFSFPYTDSGTIQATVMNNPAGGPVSGVQSPVAPYQFTGRALPSGINLYQAQANAPNTGFYGPYVNRILAVVMDSNNNVYTGYSGSLTFTSTANTWVVDADNGHQQKTVQVTGGFAEAAFNDGTAETTTVTVQLSDYAGVSASQSITFTPQGMDFAQTLNWSSGGYSPGSNYTNQIQTNYQYNGSSDTSNDLYFCLTASSHAYFSSSSGGSGHYVNDKVWTIPNASPSQTYLPIYVYSSQFESSALYASAIGSDPTCLSATPSSVTWPRHGGKDADGGGNPR